MSVTHLLILLDHPQEIFYSGQEVSGHFTFRATKEKRMRGIEIKFSGEASVYWTESRSTTDSLGRDTTETDSYSAREDYFKQSVYVLGGPDQEMTLPPGDYSYPFSFILPPNIPSSFEGHTGHIRYTIRGRINRPWRFDYKCQRVFTVLTPLDLNNEPELQEPYQMSREKVLCCGCCASAAMTFVANLPSRGFVPGQKPAAVVEVDNPTSERVTLMCLLIQKIIYTASCGKTNTSEKVLVNETLDLLEGRGSMTRRSNLQIPAVPATLRRLCKCINIEYILQVKGSLSGMHVNPTLDVPITVGTIPFRTQFPFIAPPDPIDSTPPVRPPRKPKDAPASPEGPLDPSAPPEDLPSSPGAPPASPPPYSMYPEMPPPSYEESTTGKANVRSKDDDEYVQGDMEFAPKYPMYRFK